MSSSQARIRFGGLVAQTSRVWRRAVDRHLEPFGLTEATWLPLLRVSRASKPMRQKDLAISLSLDGSSIVRLLDTLQAGGLIERREEGDDRRAKAIVLTEKGRATVEQVEAVAHRVRDEAFAGLSEAEIEAAMVVLDHVCAALTLPAEDAVA